MIFNTVNSHVNSSESNNLNTSNNDNAKENSNLPRINNQTEGLFNTIITFKNKLIQSQVFVSMIEYWMINIQEKKYYIIIIQQK